MDAVKRNALIATCLYLAALGTAWLWFSPHFVNERVHDRVSIGARAADVEKAFHVKPYSFPATAYCGKNAPPKISRIAVDETGRVPLLPVPMVMVTTTIFCFDRNDRLVGMKTERWFDEF
jgi:hypothetical protein